MHLEESFAENRHAAFHMDLTVLTVHPGTLLWTFPLWQNASQNIFPFFLFCKNNNLKKKLTSDWRDESTPGS